MSYAPISMPVMGVPARSYESSTAPFGNARGGAARASARTEHFMPSSLLASQLAVLEPVAADEAGITVDVAGAPAEIVDRALLGLGPFVEAVTPRS